MTLTIIAACLLLVALGGLLRVILGPTIADRMLASQLLGSTAVAILAVLSVALDQPAFVNVALVFAILAAVALVTFVANAGPGGGR